MLSHQLGAAWRNQGLGGNATVDPKVWQLKAIYQLLFERDLNGTPPGHPLSDVLEARDLGQVDLQVLCTGF